MCCLVGNIHMPNKTPVKRWLLNFFPAPSLASFIFKKTLWFCGFVVLILICLRLISNQVKMKTRSMTIILYYSFLISNRIVLCFCKQLQDCKQRCSVSLPVLIFYVLQVRLVTWKGFLIFPLGLFFRVMFLSSLNNISVRVFCRI